MDLELKNKRVLVIGGTGGIGGSISHSFALEGSIVGTCGRNADKVDQMNLSLQSIDSQSFADSLDASNTEKLQAWVRASCERFGGLDILVHVVSAQSFSWERCFSIDLMGSLVSVETALPYLSQSKEGAIVFIASKAALLRVPSYKAYSAIKAALISYASSLARELAPLGIRVNCVSPGEIFFKGGFWERMQKEDPALYDAAFQKNPMGRFGTPDEVARAVLFLSSPVASFISGTNLLIDGASLEHVQF